ncbi:MAG TPA: hypothetical protein VHO25_01315 [Polyangiaceae bacterium]|nr:hypothetical protein [Polyangiaceae bacterium]
MAEALRQWVETPGVMTAVALAVLLWAEAPPAKPEALEPAEWLVRVLVALVALLDRAEVD